jgi:hypothetical protein
MTHLYSQLQYLTSISRSRKILVSVSGVCVYLSHSLLSLRNQNYPWTVSECVSMSIGATAISNLNFLWVNFFCGKKVDPKDCCDRHCLSGSHGYAKQMCSRKCMACYDITENNTSPMNVHLTNAHNLEKKMGHGKRSALTAHQQQLQTAA